MKVLVLGAYGLIGLQVSQALLRQDIEVVGLARSATLGRRLLPAADWICADLDDLTTQTRWVEIVAGFDAVVNASGALQSSFRDHLVLAQRDAICALIQACETVGVSRFVQISAPGADPLASTEFLRTKGEADAVLRESELQWVILKPGLVLASTAHGGTSLLRMLAAFPLVQPMVLAHAKLQTVDVRDVAVAVARCLTDSSLARREFDLVEPKVETVESTILHFRRWLGFTAPVCVLKLPHVFASGVAWFADIAGHLGWRSPLRSTAMAVLAGNVTGDGSAWVHASGERLRSLVDTLAELPSTRQERLFARLQLLFPLLLLTLSAFWIASGLIGLWQSEAAAALLADRLGSALATSFVYAGSLIDLGIGVMMLFRQTARTACFAAIGVCVAYLVLGTVWTPGIWADPLGPFVKIFPTMALALALSAMVDER